MALYGYHPHMGTNLRREARNESAVQFATRMKSVREEAEASLKMAAQKMKEQYDLVYVKQELYRSEEGCVSS